MKILIHVQKITPRIVYSFKQICKRILGIEVDFTSKIEKFIAFEGPKFSYGKHPLGKELYFQSVELLFDHGVNEIQVQVLPWEETQCFFKVKHPKSSLPFDIFAASFFLLTRYEEYLPHKKDDLGRFSASESVAYLHNFIKDPVVDIWAHKFKKVLLKKYPEIRFQTNQFQVIPVIAVSQTFAYLHKGILRTYGGILRDLLTLDIQNVILRFRVLLGFTNDPYNTFDSVITLQKTKKRQSVVFFGLGDYSRLEKNIQHSNRKHQKIIKHVADYMEVGLKVSYDAIADLAKSKQEKKRIESINNRPLESVMCSFYKLTLPSSYRNFVELEMKEDFSMGYSNQSGFRAGTCTPFMFYDLDYDVQTPLKINPFCLTHTSFEKTYNLDFLLKEAATYAEKIKKVNGVFIPVFTNGLLNSQKKNNKWVSLLTQIWNLDAE